MPALPFQRCQPCARPHSAGSVPPAPPLTSPQARSVGCNPTMVFAPHLGHLQCTDIRRVPRCPERGSASNCTIEVGQRPKAMVKSNSLRVHLLVLLYDSFKSGLSHAESARYPRIAIFAGELRPRSSSGSTRKGRKEAEKRSLIYKLL